ncbi:MAG TPA: glucose-6-phosphate dehydrogenase assembly protein OpcA [Solirubrobacteraceae bacterium]|jgi:glucose-6-phosphate dehydrogenase assembly protein OpcA
MATADTVWSERDTTPDAIEAALRQLLVERHAENEGLVPARALNMVTFVEHAWTGEIANRMRGVGRYHASRLIVLSYDPRRTGMDARAMIAGEEHDDGELSPLRETVVVEIGPRHLDDLATITDPLVVSDMPTLLWSPHGHPEAVDALLDLSQAVLIDSVDEPDYAEALQRACELSQRAYVVDLAWLRSTPWRERIAAAFDPPSMRRELEQIELVEIRHHPESTIAGMLLVGWLAARLHWRSIDRFTLLGGELIGSGRAKRQEVAVRISADPELQVRGLSDVQLTTASGMIVGFRRSAGGLRTHRRLRDGSELEWTILGASRGEGGILGEGIRQALLRDPTYLPALEAAQGMAP